VLAVFPVHALDDADVVEEAAVVACGAPLQSPTRPSANKREFIAINIKISDRKLVYCKIDQKEPDGRIEERMKVMFLNWNPVYASQLGYIHLL